MGSPTQYQQQQDQPIANVQKTLQTEQLDRSQSQRQAPQQQISPTL